METSSPIKIAVVDDHELFRKGLIEILGGFPEIEVLFEANTGKDLLANLENGLIPEIILLDIEMPEMDGIQTAKRVAKLFRSTKIIALSMYHKEMHVIGMLKAGAKGYILKDSEPSELRKAINDVSKKGFYNSDIVGSIIFKERQNGKNETNEILPSMLGDREIDFLKYCCTELTYKEIASKMFVSPSTVEGYRERLFTKLKTKSRVGLVIYAIRNGIVNL